MARKLTLNQIIDINSTTGGSPILVALEIAVRNPGDSAPASTIRLINNTENITHQGVEYTALPFDLQMQSESGESPQLSLNLFDFNGLILSQLQQYRGGVGFKIKVMLINTADLTEPPMTLERYDVLSSTHKDSNISVSLGIANPLNLQFPRRKQMQDICQWTYKGAECGYAGPLQSCDYTLQGSNGCAAHNNEVRFGGFPALERR
jgi:lambda family phage minor tail protein L